MNIAVITITADARYIYADLVENGQLTRLAQLNSVSADKIYAEIDYWKQVYPNAAVVDLREESVARS